MVVGRRPARLAIRLRGASLPRARTDSHSTLPWTGRRHAISGAPPTIWPAGVLTGPLEGPHAKGTAAVRLFDGSAHLSFAPTTANAHCVVAQGNKPTTTKEVEKERTAARQLLRRSFSSPARLPPPHLSPSARPTHPAFCWFSFAPVPLCASCGRRPRSATAPMPSSQPRPKRRWRASAVTTCAPYVRITCCRRLAGQPCFKRRSLGCQPLKRACSVLCSPQ